MNQSIAIPHILIVDDDRQIRQRLAKFLREHGLSVSEAGNGREMQALLQRGQIDLVVLDVMMPGDDGLTLCRQLRAETPMPIILLTALSGDTDRIVGLELGADDYVTKPFNPRELLARIRALIRRAGLQANAGTTAVRSAIYHFAGWSLDVNRRALTSPDKILVVLTSSEFDLLVVFAENAQRALNREQLLEHLHGRVTNQFDRSIDVHISRLRRKIEPDPQNPTLIKTIRHEGYFFTPTVVMNGTAATAGTATT
ncbi:response regulator [Dongia sp.]|uniref:response regulator n=1 Tax=Dongia sp. TaxID=1977262 RepID=UPI0035B2E5A3